MAEGFVRRAARDLPLEVSSAGLLNLGSVGPPAELLEVVEPMGLDISAHSSRPLAEVDLKDADLVVGFEHQHIAAAVVEGDVAYDKVFYFREIVRLLESLEPPAGPEPAGGARARVAEADALRQQSEFVPNQEDPDPFGGPRQVYEDAAKLSENLSERLVGALFGSVGSEPAVHDSQRRSV